MSIAETAKLEVDVAKMLSEKLQVDLQDPETDLIEAGLLDSLMFVDLLLNLERNFGIVITLENLELDHFRSIRRIAEFLGAAAGASDGTDQPAAPTTAAQQQSIL